MADTIPHPKMDWGHPDRPQAYKEFKQMANMWFQVKNIPAAQQHNYIILWAGREGLRIFNTWGLTDEQLQDPNNIWDRFSKHVEPHENFRIHRLEFQRYKQGEEESVDEFYTRCKAKAIKCQFPDNKTLEERIIEVLISGIKYPQTQKKLLGKDDKLKLQEALDICRTQEASVTHMAQLGNIGQDSKVDAVKLRGKCKNCGGSHPYKPRENCPAYGTTCRKCGKTGHWQHVCLSSGAKPTRQRRNSRSRSRSRTRGSYRKSRSPTPKPQQRESEVHSVQHADMVSDFENLTFETVMFTQQIDGVNTANNKSTDTRSEAFTTLNIKLPRRPGTHTLKAKVDTGAQGNIIPLRIFRRMFPSLLDAEGFPKPGSTTPCRTILTAYNGTHIPQHGSITLSCQYGNCPWTDTEFFVADSDGPAILGLPSLRALNVVALNCAISTETTNLRPIHDRDSLKTQYPDRFTGIGKFPGKFHITLKEDAHPTVQPPRKYPIQLKDEMKAELDRMETLNVITKVTGPTDWVSSLAFSRKPNGKLRICLDPKDLNRASKRTYHKLPTLEEITHQFGGARVFSKLDARHGYWSIELDTESSYLTTFNSPFGRYRFLRLPFGLKVSQDIFQEKMDMILEQCPGTLGIADDVAVFGKNQEEHDKNLHNLMQVARKYGLIFNFDKCEVNIPCIKFFGCYYDAQGVHPDPAKVSDIHALPAPANVNEIQQFL